MTASRLPGAARGGSAASPVAGVVLSDPSRAPETEVAPEPHHSDHPAAASSSPRAVPDGYIRLPLSHQRPGWLRFSCSTGRRPQAAMLRVSCAWVISVQASSSPFKRGEAMLVLRSPNGEKSLLHSLVAITGIGGRVRPESVVAINRNQWSRWPGMRSSPL